MIIDTILKNCSKRQNHKCDEQCENCSYGEFCPEDCEKCLEYIHYPYRAKDGAPKRKYDCPNMADFYTCKYSYRYTSEIMYALERTTRLFTVKNLKVLSFGCGPCTDLFAIDCLRENGTLTYDTLEYHGIDYSESVWKNIRDDIKSFENDKIKISFFYKDACQIINDISKGTWIPDLIVFQYVFSDMEKHTSSDNIRSFLETFSEYYNSKVTKNTYIILNDINLGRSYGGGRDYFDDLRSRLTSSESLKGRFRDDNAKSVYYPRGYTYGERSLGEFPTNKNKFDLTPMKKYNPFNTCASAQMLIRKD